VEYLIKNFVYGRQLESWRREEKKGIQLHLLADPLNDPIEAIRAVGAEIEIAKEKTAVLEN